MSQDNRIGIDIASTYSGKGSEQAKRDVQDLEKEVSRAGAAARDSSRHHEGLAAAVSAARIAATGGALALGGLAVATINLSQSWAKAAEQVGNLHEKTEISIGDLSLMRLEAEANNTSLEKLATGYKNLSVKMFEANSGNKQAQALFKALGVEYTDSTGRLREARDVMDEVSTVFSRMEGGAGKTALAAKLLGKGVGEELVPYLNQGGEKLRAMREEAEKLGYQMDEETVRAVKDLNDNLKILKIAAEGAAGELAGPFIRSLAAITTKMREAYAAGGPLYALIAGIGKAGDEFVGDNTMKGLQSRAAGFTNDIQRMEARLADPKVRGNQRLLLEQNLQAALQGQAAVYRQIGALEGSGVEDTPTRTGAPSGFEQDGKKGRGRAGPKVMTFEELMAKGAMKRQQMYDQAEVDADREAERRTRDAERERDALEKLANQYRDMVDPMRPLQREMVNIDKLFNGGFITLDDYGRMVSNVQVRMAELDNRAREVKDGGLSELTDAIHGWGRESSKEIGRMVVDGEFNLKRLGNAFKNLAADIIAAQVQRQWMDPLLKSGVSLLGGLFGGGGHADADIQGGEDFYGNPIANAYGNAYGPGGVVPFARGGIIRRPTLFKFAAGGTLRNGLMGEAGEEGILPLKRGRDGKLGVIASGGGNVRVEIINQGSPQEVVSATPSFDADGMVVQIVLRDLRTGGPIRGSIESLMRPVS